MPSGIYKRIKLVTRETRIKLGLAKKGKKYPNRKSPPPMSEETRKLIGSAHKGLRLSEEHKKRISIANMGHLKGGKLSKEHKKKLSESHVGQKSYWKGKKRPELMGDKNPAKREDVRKKLSIAKKNGIVSKETKQKLREYHVAHPNKVFKNTSIELKIETELQKRNIFFNKQVPLCKVAIVDFYLPDYKIVIQCDGCYWHNCPIHCPTKHIEAGDRDSGQDVVLESNGFKVYRFWEHEINLSSEDCINRIELFQENSLEKFLKEGKENNYYEQE